MPPIASAIRIGIYAADDPARNERHGCGLWLAGYSACVSAAGGTPVLLEEKKGGPGLDELLVGVHGVVLGGNKEFTGKQTVDAEWLCEWCKKHNLSLLAVDHGLHALNGTHGGSLYLDLSRELPEALQHRHPPERGLRHAINVERGTRLAAIYGEGEVVVNSEHRRAVCRVARGFRVCARALDGVVEAIEAEAANWFALGVQWHPASATASGLDIQLFRGLVEACARQTHKKPSRAARVHAA
jgi:putative glutamine amidotransferase